MTVTNVEKNHDDLTMVVTAEFDAPIEQVWQLWENPRKLERWWGPPTYPATFVDFDPKPGGEANYYMTSPEGQQFFGWWRFVALNAPKALEFQDGFSDDKGVPKMDIVGTVVVSLSERTKGGTVMTVTNQWSTLEHMQKVLAMGMEEGMRGAMGQMDALLA